jgi:flagellar P-ring protein precursor FlgI
MKSWLALFLTLTLSSGTVLADRIKDLTSVAAMRSNQLIGYGLVVGLNGSGDGADVSFTAQSMKTLLNRLGVSLEGPLSDFETASSSGKIDIKNTAAVMVTAELPGFAKPGQKIDVTVSAIGKA